MVSKRNSREIFIMTTDKYSQAWETLNTVVETMTDEEYEGGSAINTLFDFVDRIAQLARQHPEKPTAELIIMLAAIMDPSIEEKQ